MSDDPLEVAMDGWDMDKSDFAEYVRTHQPTDSLVDHLSVIGNARLLGAAVLWKLRIRDGAVDWMAPTTEMKTWMLEEVVGGEEQ